MTKPHKCIADDCSRMVPHGMAMCGRHWRLVPSDIQRAVYREFAAAKGQVTQGHMDALAAARSSLRARKDGAA